MEYDSLINMLAAWVLYPAAVVVVSLGVGNVVARLGSIALGLLTAPAGFAAVIVVHTFLMMLGLGADFATVLVVAIAAVGLVLWLTTKPQARVENVWPLIAGVAVYAIAILPLIAHGRLAVVGYNLLNDAAWHTALIEWLHANGARAASNPNSSYELISLQVEQGYPLGTYAWPLVGIGLTGASAFALWAPTGALALAMLAVVAYRSVSESGATKRWATPLAVAIAAGFLPLSYQMQGGVKEILFAFTLLAAGLALSAIDFARSTGVIGIWRSSIMALISLGAMIVVFGPGAALWILPLAAFVLIAQSLRAPDRAARRKIWFVAALSLASVALLALPAVIDAIRLADTVAAVASSSAQIGNLLGRVPPTEAFNAWISPDYRWQTPASGIAPWVYLVTLVAAFLALAGIVREFRAARFFVPAAAFAGLLALLIIDVRYNRYFSAKALVAYAPIMGCATASGLIWLVTTEGRRRKLGIAAASALAITFLTATSVIMTRALVTPGDRFAELASINERIAGKGPTLINEREEYSQVLLRDGQPWYAFGLFPPGWGLRPGYQPSQEWALDIDGYSEAHLKNFELILDRRQPGGSRPPSEFERWFETEHYAVWRRTTEDGALTQLPFGLTAANGMAKLECKDPVIATFFANAEKEGNEIAVATRADGAVVVPVTQLEQSPQWTTPEPTGHQYRLGRDSASFDVKLEDGKRYELFAQGAFSAGIDVEANGQELGEVIADFGSREQWVPVGEFTAKADNSISVQPTVGWLLRPGSMQKDAIRAFAFVDKAGHSNIQQLSPQHARKFCGKQIDWIAVRR